ncbi:type 1 glutamine amidotransferase domain-containing protein [Kitasatospora sp. NPDC052896]|uniref:type 1 glutamine amidotransferase domain-containing protein n=1 Tax=Kitasatospora sp. NPDC052896 TaxID=3364061 RepID=UPI0037C59A31
MATVLVPIPTRDFDPSEVAVTWRVLTDAGHTVLFATPDGRPGVADDLMVTGRGLDPWARTPGLGRLVLVGRVLRANRAATEAYARLRRDAAFRAPLRWSDIELSELDGLVLPGGHRARGMVEYLESETLQGHVVEAFRRDLPVAAICHGVLLAARSTDPATGRSVLYGRRTTALTWSLERKAWQLARRTRFWDPDYYRTYPEEPGQPEGYLSVQQEVTRALRDPADFQDVTAGLPDARRKAGGLRRDSADDERPAFVVQDGRYVSARWPGDVHTFGKRFSAVLSGS